MLSNPKPGNQNVSAAFTNVVKAQVSNTSKLDPIGNVIFADFYSYFQKYEKVKVTKNAPVRNTWLYVTKGA